MKKKTKDLPPKPFYVGVCTPVTIHRTILESAKDFVVVLKKYEEIKQTRQAKEKKIDLFHSQINAIRMGILKLQKDLPKYDLATKNTLKIISAQKPLKPSVVLNRPTSEIEKLECELSDIERKLANL